MFNLLPCPTLFDTVGFEVAPKGRPGGIRASDLQAPSPNCLVVHPLDLPKIPKSKIQNPQNPKSKIPKIPKSQIQNPQNPKSPKSQNPKSPKSKVQNPQNPKIQNPKSPKSKIPKIPKSKIQNPQNPKSKIPKIQNPNFFGRILGILDFGSLCSNSLREAPNAPNFGFWRRILDFGDFGFWGFWILGPESQIQNPQNPAKKAWILEFGDFGFRILDFGDFGDFGFWIVGILDFGDFAFWILGIWDFGFWGSWILDFGLGILDGHLVTKFWMLHEKRSCTRRPGSADFLLINKSHLWNIRVFVRPACLFTGGFCKNTYMHECIQ